MTRSPWKSAGAQHVWIRWWISGRILTAGAWLLAGAALAGTACAEWWALAAWLLSIGVRIIAHGFAKQGSRDACRTCEADCNVCLARAAAASLSKVKLPGGDP